MGWWDTSCWHRKYCISLCRIKRSIIRQMHWPWSVKSLYSTLTRVRVILCTLCRLCERACSIVSYDMRVMSNLNECTWKISTYNFLHHFPALSAKCRDSNRVSSNLLELPWVNTTCYCTCIVVACIDLKAIVYDQDSWSDVSFLIGKWWMQTEIVALHVFLLIYIHHHDFRFP